jgi:hypothetical protein
MHHKARMLMTHRTTVGLGGLLTIGLIVAACGGDDATAQPDAATEAPTSAATEAPTAEATEAPADPTEAPAPATEVPVAPTEAPAEDPGPATSGPGTALLVIGDQSYPFEGVFCTFSPEEAQNTQVSFAAQATGDAAGTRVQFSADILDPNEEGRYEGDGVIQSIGINDITDFENPAVGHEALAGFPGFPEWAFVIDGKNISADAPFDDSTTDDIEQTAGTLTVTCP